MSNATFSQKLNRLEEVVAKLESPDIELEEGLKLLEEGVELHKSCQQMLSQTQAKITKLLEGSTKPESESEPDAEITSAVDAKVETASLFESDQEQSPTKHAESDGLPF